MSRSRHRRKPRGPESLRARRLRPMGCPHCLCETHTPDKCPQRPSFPVGDRKRDDAAALGLDDESIERAWLGAVDYMKAEGLDPDEVLRRAAENLQRVEGAKDRKPTHEENEAMVEWVLHGGPP